jgi:hypothetical protein
MLVFVLASLLISGPQNNFVWPKEISHLIDVPAISQRINLPYIDTGNEPKPDTRDVRYVDINGDGVKEAFAGMGPAGNAGTLWCICRKSGNTWIDIGEVQGGITFCEKRSGYYQLEVWSNGGGGSQARTLFRFQNGRYQMIRNENYERGVFMGAASADQIKQWNEVGTP